LLKKAASILPTALKIKAAFFYTRSNLLLYTNKNMPV